jgi:hypothetical protein
VCTFNTRKAGLQANNYKEKGEEKEKERKRREKKRTLGIYNKTVNSANQARFFIVVENEGKKYKRAC